MAAAVDHPCHSRRLFFRDHGDDDGAVEGIFLDVKRRITAGCIL